MPPRRGVHAAHCPGLPSLACSLARLKRCRLYDRTPREPEDEYREQSSSEGQPLPSTSGRGLPVYVMLPLDTVWLVERDGKQVLLLMSAGGCQMHQVWVVLGCARLSLQQDPSAPIASAVQTVQRRSGKRQWNLSTACVGVHYQAREGA